MRDVLQGRRPVLTHNVNDVCFTFHIILTHSTPVPPTPSLPLANEECAGLQERTVEIKNRADLDAMAELMDIQNTFNREDARKKTGHGSNNNEKRCFASGYTGYTNGDNVGGIKFTLKGSGVATLNYGNCWDKGNVKLYINGAYQAKASKKQNKVDYKFAFTKGDVIELKDEDGYDI